MRTEYLSEEELNQLINQTQQESGIMPPAYLEEKIMKQVREERIRQNRKEFYLYSAKIIAAAAAAIILMFTAPQNFQNSFDTAQRPFVTIQQKLDAAAGSFHERMPGTTGNTYQKEENRR